jgi:large subunit ribosomal protein L35Ae
MSSQIYGRIMNYRIGIRTQKADECLIQFDGVVSVAQAGKFISRKVVWQSSNKKTTGKIIGFHGRNGTVVVRFKRGVPGQALGTTVKLIA